MVLQFLYGAAWFMGPEMRYSGQELCQGSDLLVEPNQATYVAASGVLVLNEVQRCMGGMGMEIVMTRRLGCAVVFRLAETSDSFALVLL